MTVAASISKAMFIVNGASMPAGASRWMEIRVAILLNLSMLIVFACVLILFALRNPPVDRHA